MCRSSCIRPLLATLAFVALFCSTACSFLAGGSQTLTITTDPPDAEVIVNGASQGQGVMNVRVKRKARHSILVRREGYQTYARTTDTRLSTVGIVDVMGGRVWVVPFLGMLAGGAWTQNPENLSVVLQEERECP